MIEEIVEEEHWIRHNAGWSLARGRDGRCLMQPVMDSGFHSNLDENQDLSSSSSEQSNTSYVMRKYLILSQESKY